MSINEAADKPKDMYCQNAMVGAGILENKMRIQSDLSKVKRGSREAVEYCSLQVFTDKLHQHITNSLNIVERAFGAD